MGGTGGGIHPLEFSLYDFAPKSIKLLNDLGIKVFLFTNQSRVARGYFTEEELLSGFRQMEGSLSKEGAFLDDIYYCPHYSGDNCDCKKPKVGLLLKAKEEHDLDLKKCYVVGDTGSSDMVAASKVGAKKILVKTGWGKSSLTEHRESWKEVEPDYIAENLVDAVKWIYTDFKK
ncbi:HAD-IIIA family hydrolase [Pseudogracilibacillus auburnensis]|nr:HAD-IIIA family hydrolase [Pseudogracilibacillus auburnensis]